MNRSILRKHLPLTEVLLHLSRDKGGYFGRVTEHFRSGSSECAKTPGANPPPAVNCALGGGGSDSGDRVRDQRGAMEGGGFQGGIPESGRGEGARA